MFPFTVVCTKITTTCCLKIVFQGCVQKQLSLKQFCLDLQLNLILNQMQSSTHHYYFFIFQLKYVFDI